MTCCGDQDDDGCVTMDCQVCMLSFLLNQTRDRLEMATERIAKLEAMWPVTRDGVRMTNECVTLFARFTDRRVRETTWNPFSDGPTHPKYWYSTREAAEASNPKGTQP